MGDYYSTCPHLKEVRRERGDFVRDGKKEYWKVREIFYETVKCSESGFEIFEKGVFFLGSGYDPEALLVQCKGCGGKYYIFPKLKQVKVRHEPKEVNRAEG